MIGRLSILDFIACEAVVLIELDGFVWTFIMKRWMANKFYSALSFSTVTDLFYCSFSAVAIKF